MAGGDGTVKGHPVGTLCEVIDTERVTQRNVGAVVEVLSTPQSVETRSHANGHSSYMVMQQVEPRSFWIWGSHHVDGSRLWIRPENLRPLRDPDPQTTDTEDKVEV